jgi:hypothetical protein
MMAQASRDWGVFKQLFADHWQGFKQLRPRYDTPYYDSLVEKMLDCGNPDTMGYLDAYHTHVDRRSLDDAPPIDNAKSLLSALAPGSDVGIDEYAGETFAVSSRADRVITARGSHMNRLTCL